MLSRTHPVRRLLGTGSLVCLLALALVLAGCDASHYPQSTLAPKGDLARATDGLFQTVVFWAAIVFVLVEGALLYCIFRFRGKPGDAEPEQVHGNTTLEIVWTMIPALVLAMIAVPTVKEIFRENAIPTNNPLTVEVVGHQWWWEFRYPEYGITTANELHVPVGRTVSLRMKTSDVVHSFWVPQFAGKRDVFPNRETRLWFTAEQGGFYRGQCAEFCGIQHGKMAFWISADTPQEFDAYVAGMKRTAALQYNGMPAAPAQPAAQPAAAGTTTQGATVAAAALPAQAQQAAPGDSVLAQGQKLFMQRGCVGCHSLTAIKAPQGMIGPNLAHVGSRRYIAAGMEENTDANMARWIMHPQAVKVGVKMPDLGVPEPAAQALVAYFRALAKQ